MLLRSSSSPLLNSWIAHQSPEHHHHHHHHPQQHPAVDHHHHHHHQAVVSLPHAPPPRPTRGKRMTTAMLPRTLSDSDLSHPSPPIRKQNSLLLPYDYAEKEDTNIINKKTEEESPPSPSPPPSPRYVPLSAVHSATLVDNEECAEGAGGDGRGRGTGKKCGWGDKRGSSDPENIAATDSYYRKMIQVDPGNSLLLGNYAKFLKESAGLHGARNLRESVRRPSAVSVCRPCVADDQGRPTSRELLRPRHPSRSSRLPCVGFLCVLPLGRRGGRGRGPRK